MLQLKNFPEIPVSTREESREFRPHPEQPRFCLLAREVGSFPCVFWKEFPAFPSHLKRRRSPQERREELQGRATIPRVPQMSQSMFSLHSLDFQAEDRLTPRWHVEQSCGKASLESLVGKPRVKATDPLIQAKGSATLLLQLGGKRTCMPPLETRTDSPGETPEEPQNPCQHWKGILRFGTEFTQDHRPRHRWERNPERPPSNSHGDWPFLRPPERVPEVPVVSLEHLLHLERIQEVLPSRREEARFR